jgi:uncharacterized protein YndB with AHSA1/START domain
MNHIMDIRKTYHFPFSVELVYSAWTSSETVIAPATRMNINPVVGGDYHLFIETADYTATNKGKFLEIVKNNFLKYSWEWNGDGEITEIAVKFDAKSNGTEIHLLHSGFRSSQSANMHDSGWDSYFEGLENFMSDFHLE